MADEKEPGLHLADQVVHQISGPVSMYYLKPKSNRFFGKERHNLPLIMLWGDQHFSVNDMCTPCSDKGRGQKSCYTIYDKSFLKELDKFASEYPVDFYTEYSKDHLEFGRKYASANFDTVDQVLFKRFVRDTTLGCHTKTLRNKPNYEQQCPTKSIRWHFADVRTMFHSFEYQLLRPFLIEYEGEGDLRRFFNWKDDKSNPPSTHLPMFQKILTSMRVRIYENHEKMMDPDTRKATTELRATMVKALFEDLSKTGGSAPTKWMNVFRAFVRASWLQQKTPSLILKQIRKMDPSLTRGDVITFLTKAFAYGTAESVDGSKTLYEMEHDIKGYPPSARAYIESFFSKDIDVFLQEEKNNVPTVDPLLLAAEKELGEDTFFEIWQGLEAINTYLSELSDFTLDIYTLLRMLKTPEQSSPPYLVFGFFGEWHTHRIVAILRHLSNPGVSNYFDYEVVYSVPIQSIKKRSHRCILIDKPIRLAADLRQHTEAIQTHPAHAEELQKYRRILEQEEAGRRGGPSYWNRGNHKNNQTRKNKGNKGNKNNKVNRNPGNQKNTNNRKNQS